MPWDAPDAEVRRARRLLSLATHPDKNAGVPGADAACKRVLAAGEALLDPGRRAAHAAEMAAARALAGRSIADALFEATGVDVDSLDESVLMRCDCCEAGLHQLPRAAEKPDARAARRCDECGGTHAWVETAADAGAWWAWLRSGCAVTELRMYLASDGVVYDATAAGTCSGILAAYAQASRGRAFRHPHVNPLRAAGGGGGGGSGGGGARPPGRAAKRRAKQGRG
jgi:hypothetical protein